jgi:radical SAM protein with 4Fe4S-binding SPASM domain
MPIETAKRVITEHFSKKDSFEEIEFDFMGGEPLLEFNAIKEIAEWLWSENSKLPYILFATTNGTLLSEKIKDWFTLHRDKIVLGLSYDGNPVMQDGNRSNSALNIDLSFFINTWTEQPVKMTISPNSIHELSEGVIYLHNQGVKNIYANLALGIRWGQDNLKIYANQLLKLKDYYIANPDIQPCSLFDIDLRFILMKKNTQKYCGAGTGTFFVDYDGLEYPCHLFSPMIDKRYTNTMFADIDFSNADLFSTELCKECLLYNICPTCCGMNYLMTGTLNKRSAFMCEAFKIQCMVNAQMKSEIYNKQQQLNKDENIIANAINKLINSQFK